MVMQCFSNVDYSHRLKKKNAADTLYNYRMVRNVSRGEEGRVLPEDLHRILGETCWQPIRTEDRWLLYSFSSCFVRGLFGSFSYSTHTHTHSPPASWPKGGVWLCESLHWSTTSTTCFSLNHCDTEQTSDVNLATLKQFFSSSAFFSNNYLDWKCWTRAGIYTEWTFVDVMTVHVPNNTANRHGFFLYTVKLFSLKLTLLCDVWIQITCQTATVNLYGVCLSLPFIWRLVFWCSSGKDFFVVWGQQCST